jgi:shikimate dehydrogenase
MVIGNPVAHSMSPAIHNAAYQALGLDFVYVACQVEDLKGALAGMRALSNFRGMSITIPHKIEAMKYVDEVLDVDRAIGSINTVVREPGRLIGLGTDGPGALLALRDAGVDLAGKEVLILGAGGAARAIAFPLVTDTKIKALTLLDIDESLLSGLSTNLKAATEVAVVSEMFTDDALEKSMAEADIVVQCTSVGMHPNSDISLIPPKLLRAEQVVFDIVYTPLETRLLCDAKAKGLQTVSGVEMFVNQAAAQFEQFTGVKAPREVMRQVVMERLQG